VTALSALSDEMFQELRDRRALNDLLVRYCRGIDRLDRELVLSCFHPDAHDDHGTIKGSPQQLVDRIFSRPPEMQASFSEHKLTNVYLELDGDTAWGESYITMHQVRDGQLVRGDGRFIDRFERRHGEWRIAHRRVILEWATPGRGYDQSVFTPGRRDRLDPSYER
jgi:hypothetical protein